MMKMMARLEEKEMNFADWEYILETETGKQMYIYKTKEPETIQEGLFLEYIAEALSTKKTWMRETDKAIYNIRYVKGTNSFIMTMVSKPAFTSVFFPHQGEREDLIHVFSQREEEDKSDYKREALIILKKPGITSEEQERVRQGKFYVQVIGEDRHVGRLEGAIRRYENKKKSGSKWTIITGSLIYNVDFKQGDMEVLVQPRGEFQQEVVTYLKQQRVLF